MMGFILFIHAVVCIFLVLAVLMQAGRGGGLTESFASAESVFGTQTNVFMVRITTIMATIFFVTSLSLAVLSSKKKESLMSNRVSAPVMDPKDIFDTSDLPKIEIPIPSHSEEETPTPATNEPAAVAPVAPSPAKTDGAK